MNFISSIVVLIAAASCANANNACTAIWAPVCGSDGHTYPSKCFLEAARQQGKDELTLVHSGACKSKRSVDDEDQHCPEHSKHGICTLEYAPVCSSNGKTYSNKCQMCAEMYNQDTTLKVVHPGKCGSLDYCLPRDKSGACTYEYRPICGSDGKTYANRCIFCYSKYQKEEQGEELKMDYVGECQNCPARSKIGACERIYKPVCGSNGVTYGNDCLLCKAIFDQGKSHNNIPLVKKHEGACEEEATLYQAEFCRPEWKNGECTREFNPICGTDGKTYGNPCTFCYAMYQKESNGNNLKVRREGPCKPEDTLQCPESYKSGICTMEYNPVCGSDEHIYSNPCQFCYEQHKQAQNGVELYFGHMGICYM